MAPEERDFLCGGWVWDPLRRELRYYQRKGKGWSDEPEAVERLQEVRSITWHRWSQQPMGAAGGGHLPSKLSRIVVEYRDGGTLTLNENDRECAGKLAAALAEAFGVPLVEAGAPGGPRPGTAPRPDEMGRLLHRGRRTETLLDPRAGEIIERRRRWFGLLRRERRIPFREVRRLELSYEVKGEMEEFRLDALWGPMEERLTIAAYQGYEGWADRAEWEGLAAEVARAMGVELTRSG